jgi:hypothetical protein
MINTDPRITQTGDAENMEVDSIVSTGAGGAKVLAGLATAVVIGLWLAFYLLVFVPRSVSP